MAFIFSRTVTDSSWAGHAFRVRDKDLDEERVMKRKYYTTTSRLFVDTSWGGHFAVNPFPQFTRNCDVNHKSIYTGNNVTGTKGMEDDFGGVGRWWGEVLNDNQQEIHIRAGVVRFNSMFTFFTNFYNVDASILSRRGRATSLFYSLGKAAGFVGSIMLQPFILGAEAINFFLSTPRTKFYYLQPAMHMYWRAVSTMMNTYMVNAGLTSFFDPGNNADTDKKLFDPVVTNYNALADWKEQARVFGNQYDDRILTASGGIDVFAISTRAQRLGQIYRKQVTRALDEAFDKIKPAKGKEPSPNRAAVLEDFIDKKLDSLLGSLPNSANVQTVISNKIPPEAMPEGKAEVSYLELYEIYQTLEKDGDKPKEASGLLVQGGDLASRQESYPNSVDGDESIMLENGFAEGRVSEEGEVMVTPTETTAEAAPEEKTSEGGFMNYFRRMGQAVKGNMEMGAEFVTFRINNTGSQSESFSNTSGESGLMETINSNSSAARAAKFNFAGGNIGGPIGTLLSVTEELVAGVLDSVKLGGLMAMSGSAFIDIQKVYQNSSADMMGTSITIPLRAWSADPWTIAKDIAYPLFCILALGMPKSTGSRSYDEPFLIELFLKGRSQIREGRVRSISITRGVGDVAWTKEGHALGIDVTVDFEDMSGVVGVPINPSTSRLMSLASGAASSLLGETVGGWVEKGAAAASTSTYSEDNKFGDYMNVLAAVDLDRQINTLSKYSLRLAQTRVSMEQWRSPHMAVSMFADTLPGRLLQAIGRPTDRN